MNRVTLSLFAPALFLGVLGVSGRVLAQTPSQTGTEDQFFKIAVQHYDAGMMADIVTRQDAIVVVPPNFVISDLILPGGSPVTVRSAGPAVAAGGASSRLAPDALPPAPTRNRLPEGVQRIYALRADNSLVIQKGSTP